MSDPALKRLAAGLKLDGFRLRHTANGPSFRGVIQVGSAQIGLRLEYINRAYSEPPRVIVENPEALRPGVIAHLDEANELCVVDRSQYVTDRHALCASAVAGNSLTVIGTALV